MRSKDLLALERMVFAPDVLSGGAVGAPWLPPPECRMCRGGCCGKVACRTNTGTSSRASDFRGAFSIVLEGPVALGKGDSALWASCLDEIALEKRVNAVVAMALINSSPPRAQSAGVAYMSEPPPPHYQRCQGVCFGVRTG